MTGYYINGDVCVDTSITKVTKEIEELHAKVQVEKTIRSYKEEYESISRVINQLPSRKELAAYVVDVYGLMLRGCAVLTWVYCALTF